MAPGCASPRREILATSRFRFRSYRAVIRDDQPSLRQTMTDHGGIEIDRRDWLFYDCVQMSLAVSRACAKPIPIAIR